MEPQLRWIEAIAQPMPSLSQRTPVPCHPPRRRAVSINGERSKAISSWWSNGGNSSKAPFDQPFSLVL